MKKPFEIKNIMLGVSTAATQIEGGTCDSNWCEFAKTVGNVADGTSPDPACDHWNLVGEDTKLMKDMNMEIYRFGIEWAKIQPTENSVSAEAIAHYREEIELLIESGIKPLLTIHHFSHPMWFEAQGGFAGETAPIVFAKFVKIVLEAFGDIVDDYITINEPNVFAVNSYYFGVWYPKLKSLKTLRKVYKNFAICHLNSYKQIHEYRSSIGKENTKVGFANHLRVFEGKNPKNPVHKFLAYLLEKMFQTAITDAMMSGVASFPVPKLSKGAVGKYYDFIGINYYTRSTVSGFSDGVKEGVETNDLGWEIYPQGLITLAEELYSKYKAPIWITENGTADAKDAFRAEFIFNQLEAIAKSDLPIERYYHWSFTDNWEWAEGREGKFGLVEINYETQERILRNSGAFYAEIAKNHCVSQEMIDKYLK